MWPKPGSRLSAFLKQAAIASCALLVLSECVGCMSVLVAVPPPAECPLPNEATTLELAEMEMDGMHPNLREYVLDRVVPYCAGIEAMRKGDK